MTTRRQTWRCSPQCVQRWETFSSASFLDESGDTAVTCHTIHLSSYCTPAHKSLLHRYQPLSAWLNIRTMDSIWLVTYKHHTLQHSSSNSVRVKRCFIHFIHNRGRQRTYIGWESTKNNSGEFTALLARRRSSENTRAMRNGHFATWEPEASNIIQANLAGKDTDENVNGIKWE